ncbi:alpha/beta hydrolase family protein [Dyadobacter bucti]|uniref:alpha/beta hydrolase family protein n=1 Tax=Dyadobacter bucti TaxID=2572203 RepID=UPI003F70694A
MKKLSVLLLFLTTFGYAQKPQVPAINTNPFKIDSLLWDLKVLSIAPEVKWTTADGPVRTLLYKSVDYEGKPTEVFAYYSNPDIVSGKKSGQKFPGMVLIHGGGGKAFKEWVEKWANEGYAAIAMDLSGNGPDGKKIGLPGPDQSNENKFEKIETANIRDVWTYHAVASGILAHSLLLSLPEIDKNRTAVTGISWGGYLTCIVGSLDNRFKAAVPVYGCGFYDESDVFKVPLDKLSMDSKKRWMKFFDPSVYLPYASSPFFFINGNKDKHYNVIPYHKTYSLVKARGEVCIIPEMRHSHEAGWEPKEIKFFVDGIVNEGPRPINVKFIVDKENELELMYETFNPNSVSMAEFYYTNDLTSTNEQRTWTKQEAKIDLKNKTISTLKPKEGYKYAFFYFKDQNGISGSSRFLIQE